MLKVIKFILLFKGKVHRIKTAIEIALNFVMMS